MLIALVGIALIVIGAFVGFMFTRTRWVKRQPGAFAGAIRLLFGQYVPPAENARRAC